MDSEVGRDNKEDESRKRERVTGVCEHGGIL
jgi:hypothetical protein